MSTAEETLAVDAQIAPPLDNRQRGFRIALLCAFLFHSALLIEANRNATGRRMGETSGQDDAIAVELVTQADLESREAVAVPPPGATPAPPPQPEAKPEKPEEPQQAQPEPQPETPPQEKAETPQPPPPEPKPPEEKASEAKAAEQPKAPVPDFSSVLQDLATAPQPSEAAKAEAAKPEPAKTEPVKPAEAKPAEATPPQKSAEPAKKKVARATPPSTSDFAPAGRSSGVSRPPGITRSGENDAFGLGVVRALRATMPPPNGKFGRVTVRLILNENGDLIDVTVLQSSGVPGLDQRVVFATKQTNFPLPPYKSTQADRTFLISYVYR